VNAALAKPAGFCVPLPAAIATTLLPEPAIGLFPGVLLLLLPPQPIAAMPTTLKTQSNHLRTVPPYVFCWFLI
jgi:hypothetical protein